jgi:hypothetical protein
VSEKLFRFLLSELEVIRICCTVPNCGGVAEMKVEKLKSSKHMAFVCPVCGNGTSSAHAAGAGVSDALDKLGDAIGLMKSTGKANDFVVEFVLPDPDAPKVPDAAKAPKTP